MSYEVPAHLQKKFKDQNELAKIRLQFEDFDIDGNGHVDEAELLTILKKLGIEAPKNQVKAIMNEVDADGNGNLDFGEFLAVVLKIKEGASDGAFAQAYSKKYKAITSKFGTHSYSETEKSSIVSYMNKRMKDEKDLIKHGRVPIDADTPEIFTAVADGVIIARFINACFPKTIPSKDINMKKNMNAWEINQNHNSMLRGAKKIGCRIVNIGANDLKNGSVHLILAVLWQVVKIHLLKTVSMQNIDALKNADDGDVELPPEKILLRWVNYHVKNAGLEHVVKNFTTDLKDGVVLTYLLNQIAPDECTLDPMDQPEGMKRAEAILEETEKINCRKFIEPKHIVKGNNNFMTAFIANLFLVRPAMGNAAQRAARELQLQKERAAQLEKERQLILKEIAALQAQLAQTEADRQALLDALRSLAEQFGLDADDIAALLAKGFGDELGSNIAQLLQQLNTQINQLRQDRLKMLAQFEANKAASSNSAEEMQNECQHNLAAIKILLASEKKLQKVLIPTETTLKQQWEEEFNNKILSTFSEEQKASKPQMASARLQFYAKKKVQYLANELSAAQKDSDSSIAAAQAEYDAVVTEGETLSKGLAESRAEKKKAKRALGDIMSQFAAVNVDNENLQHSLQDASDRLNEATGHGSIDDLEEQFFLSGSDRKPLLKAISRRCIDEYIPESVESQKAVLMDAVKRAVDAEFKKGGGSAGKTPLTTSIQAVLDRLAPPETIDKEAMLNTVSFIIDEFAQREAEKRYFAAALVAKLQEDYLPSELEAKERHALTTSIKTCIDLYTIGKTDKATCCIAMRDTVTRQFPETKPQEEPMLVTIQETLDSLIPTELERIALHAAIKTALKKLKMDAPDREHLASKLRENIDAAFERSIPSEHQLLKIVKDTIEEHCPAKYDKARVYREIADVVKRFLPSQDKQKQTLALGFGLGAKIKKRMKELVAALNAATKNRAKLTKKLEKLQALLKETEDVTNKLVTEAYADREALEQKLKALETEEQRTRAKGRARIAAARADKEAIITSTSVNENEIRAKATGALAEKADWLYKQSKGIAGKKRWDRKWVIIKGKEILLQRGLSEMRPEQILDITDCTATIIDAKKHIFSFNTLSGSFVFRGDDAEDVNEWIKSLKNAQRLARDLS